MPSGNSSTDIAFTSIIDGGEGENFGAFGVNDNGTITPDVMAGIESNLLPGAFLTVILYPYHHPTLGQTILDIEMLELMYLYIMVQATSKQRCSIFQFDFSTATTIPNYLSCRFPRSRATGNRPYIVIDPTLRPSQCPPATVTTPEHPKLLTDPEAMRFARRCVRYLIEDERPNFGNEALEDYISERLGLITEYFLWYDSLIVEEWTLPILCSSLPFGMRKYYLWNRRVDFDARFTALFGTRSFTESEDREEFLLDILSQIILFIVEQLATAPYLSGCSKPGILDGIAFSYLSILLSAPINEHDGLSRVLLDGSIGSVLEAYCTRLNFIVRSGIWKNSQTFLLGLNPSERKILDCAYAHLSDSPYPNNPNSARSIRERRWRMKQQAAEQERPDSSEEKKPLSGFQKVLQLPSNFLTSIIQSVYRPLIITGSDTSPKQQPTRRGSEMRQNGIQPQVFILVAAAALLGFLLSGKSPIKLGST